MMGYVLALFVDQLTGGFEGLSGCACSARPPPDSGTCSASATPWVDLMYRLFGCYLLLLTAGAVSAQLAAADNSSYSYALTYGCFFFRFVLQAWACWTSRSLSSARCCFTCACLASSSSAPPPTLTSTSESL